MDLLRRAIERQVRLLVGGGDPPPDAPDAPEQSRDLGLFGPDAVCWKVHGDFTTMMIGGVTALLLQMLHPGALAGVWDYSNFREDMTGRLKGTAQFIAGTTYGDTDRAMALIARVKAIHARVAGVLPDGRPYAADDPELLTWVHVAEVSSFLAAYLHHREPLSAEDQDRYFAETARIAELLGAKDPPRTRRAVEAYLQAARPQLVYDERTREVAGVLLGQKFAPAMAPFGKLVFSAAKDLLPGWAAAMHGFTRQGLARPGLELGVRSIGSVMRWGLPDSAEKRARRRASSLVK